MKKVTATTSRKTVGNISTMSLMPLQTVSQSVKNTKAWQQQNVDAIIGMAEAQSTGLRSSRANKVINYDILNSKFREEDFNHLMNPYNVADAKFTGKQSKLRNINIIRPKAETLKGEEMKLGLNFRAVAVNGAITTERNAEKQNRIMEIIKANAQMMAQGQDPEQTPEEIASKFDSEYEHPTEKAINQLLNFVVRKDKTKMKLSKGWEHSIPSAEEIYYLSVIDGHPHTRVCNPLNVEVDLENDNPFIHEGFWAREERMVSPATLVDLYGKELSKKDIKRIYSGELGGGDTMGVGQQPGYMYREGGSMPIDNKFKDAQHNISLCCCVWRSVREIGYLTMPSDVTGNLETTVVDGSFKLTPEMVEAGATIEKAFITEIRKGSRIANDIYVDMGPLENQTGKLPYVGYIYNSLNSTSVSIVDLAKPILYSYITTWFRLEEELAKAKGKKFLMDLAALPKSKGWTVDQWMYYFDNMGVAWINSMEEGRKGDKTSISTFNQFQSIDMTLSQTVGQFMEILNKLEDQLDSITGVSPQREGDIGRNETATGANRAIIASTNATKPYYYYHDVCRKEVLNQLMELCKVAYQDGVQIEDVVDETTRVTIKLDRGTLNEDMGVFLTDSFEDAETLKELRSYLGLAMQSSVATLEDVAKVIGSKSVSEVRSTIIAAERERQQREEQKAQADRESQENVAKEMSAVEREKIAFEKYKFDTEVEKDLQIASMSHDPQATDADAALKYAKAKAEESKSALEEKKEENATKLKKEELDIKRKEVNLKKNNPTTNS